MLHRSLRLPASVPQRPKSARAPARLGIDVGMTSWLSLFLDAQTIMLASMNALTARVTPAKVVEVRARARARIALENARERPHRARERARALPIVVSRRRRSIGTRRDFIGDLRRVASEDARDGRLTAKITITRVGSTFQRAKRGGRARECERRRRSGEGVRGGARADARDDVRGAGVGHDGDVAGGAKRGRSVCGKGEVHES